MTSPSGNGRLPRGRAPGSTYRIAVVCLGNICRSPIAEVVLTDKLARAGLDGHVEVVSAGTGPWHVGEPMDRRAAALLTAHGYDATAHRGQQFDATWFAECDLILAMDTSNHADITDQLEGADEGRVRMFRDFDPRAGDGDRDVPDPYFGGDEGFETVLAMVDRTATAVVEMLERELNGG
jgi:protein-tyrosine phosphatase